MTPETSSAKVAPMQLGRYLLISPLLSCCGDELDEAYDPRLDRRVLLQRLAGEEAWLDGLALAQLDHPHILRVHDVSGPPPAGLGYVMFALPDGGTLAERLARVGSGRAFFGPALCQVGEALCAAHASGFVHRGLDATAVLLSRDGQAQVYGFTRAPRGVERGLAEERDLRRYVALIEQVLGRSRWLRRVHRLAEAAEGTVAQRLEQIQALLKTPRVARRRMLVAGLSLAVVAAGLGLLLQPRLVQRCPPLEREAIALWSPSRAGVIRSALVRTGKPYARDAARRIEELVGRYLGRFASIGQTMCRSRRGSGQIPEAVRELRLACLNGQLRKLDATLTVLEDADEQIAQRAVSLVDDRLSAAELEECLLVTPDLLSPPPPPQRAVEVARVREALARGEALSHAGKYQLASSLFEKATSAAEQTRYPPVQAEAALARGVIARQLGEFADSVKWLHRAVALAEGCRQDRLAAQAWMMLIFVVGDRQAQYTLAEEYAQYAAASLQRCERCEDLQPRFDEELGKLRYDQGRSSEALVLYKEALDRRQRLHAPTTELIGNYNVLANVLDSLERGREALQYHLRALDLAEKEYGPSHPKVSVFLSNLALTQESLGQLSEARASGERALEIAIRSLGPEHPNVGRCEDTLGGILMEGGHYAEAQAYLDRAIIHLSNAMGPRHPVVSTVLVTLGTLQLRTGRYDKALAAFQRALRIREAAYAPTQLELAYACIGVARALIGLADLKGAEAHLGRARYIMAHSEELQAGRQELQASLLFAEALCQARAPGALRPSARRAAQRARELYQALGDGFRYEVGEIDSFLR